MGKIVGGQYKCYLIDKKIQIKNKSFCPYQKKKIFLPGLSKTIKNAALMKLLK